MSVIETKFFLDKVQRLYPTFEYPDEFDISLWAEVLKGFSQTEILEGLKRYRQNEEYSNAPTPAEFKKYLNHDEPVHHETIEVARVFNPSSEFMRRDKALGVHETYLLSDYERAVKHILDVSLPEMIGRFEYAKLDYSGKYWKAMNLGLFQDFDTILENCKC